jgi:hypothetical protein
MLLINQLGLDLRKYLVGMIQTWEEHQELVKRLTLLKPDKYITNYKDILSAFDNIPKFKNLIDFGSGPSPVFRHPKLCGENNYVVDPLFDYYAESGAWPQVAYTDWYSSSIQVPTYFADVVFCINTINYTESWEDTLAEISRITAKGGFLFLIFDIADKEGFRTLNAGTVLDRLNCSFTTRTANFNRTKFQYSGQRK